MIKIGRKYKTKKGYLVNILAVTSTGEYLGELQHSKVVARYNANGEHKFAADYDIQLGVYSYLPIFSDYSVAGIFGSHEFTIKHLETHPLADKVVGFMRMINGDVTSVKYISLEEFTND